MSRIQNRIKIVYIKHDLEAEFVLEGKILRVEVSNKFVMAYIYYIVFVWLCECSDLVCFLLNIPQQTIVSRILIILMYGGGVIQLKKLYAIKRNKYSFTKLIVSIIILVLGMIKSLYPDYSSDTGNYHLIAQSSDFVNWFENGFAPGTFQIWGFRLGDRLFNLFSRILGYRYGTLLNIFIVVIIYIQITDFLDTLFDRLFSNYQTEKIFKIINLAVLAIIALTVHDLVMVVATYYVDLLAIPILLEMLYKVCLIEENKEHQYFAFLGGIAFALKMTNIVYIVPLLFVYIIKNIKIINIIDYLKCFIIGIVPFSIYAVYNFVCTGNPVFPYFNLLFKSKYFSSYNFKDPRWGPTSTKEIFMWTFKHIFYPEYRQSEIYDLHLIVLQIAFIIFVFSILIYLECLFRKKVKKAFPIELYIVFLLSGLFWSASTGYSRYFILGDIMLLIILVVSVMYLIQAINIYMIKYSLVILMYLMLWISYEQIGDSIRGREWSWRRVTKEQTINELSNVFKDQLNNFNYLDADVFFLTSPTMGGYAFLSNEDAPIFNISYLDWIDKENYYLFKNSFEKMVSEEKSIFDIKFSDFNDWNTYERKLYGYGFEIMDKSIVNNGIFNLIYIKLGFVQEFMFSENTEIPIDENNKNYRNFVHNGFSYVETVNGSPVVWTSGKSSSFTIQFEEGYDKDFRLILDLIGTVEGSEQNVIAYANGIELENVLISRDKIYIDVPRKYFSENKLYLELRYPNAYILAEKGISTDTRELAFLINRIRCEEYQIK